MKVLTKDIQSDLSLCVLALARELESSAGADISVSIKTSGTTGTPKDICVNLSKALKSKRGGSEEERWVLTYDPSRWAGISVVLHAISAGCFLVVPKNLDFSSILESFCDFSPTHMGCTPSMFRNLCRYDSAGILSKSDIKQLTFGGEFATQTVLDLAKSTFPGARISHVYASTEFGDICSVSDGLEGIPSYKFDGDRFYFDGQLYIDGKPTGDIWKYNHDTDRYLFFGRVNEVINVGGNKVSPVAIEEFVLKSGAFAAKAYAIPSQLLGSLVAIDYVGGPPEVDLRRMFVDNFPKYARPVLVRKVENIELTAAGKVKRS